MRWYAQNKWKCFICYKNRKQSRLTSKTNTIIKQKHLDQQKFSTLIQLLPIWSKQLSPMRRLGIFPFGISPNEVFFFSTVTRATNIIMFNKKNKRKEAC